MSEFPTSARAVIVGGGVIGCSLAYHLAKLGWSDVVLLERRQLTCGTTWHAAGLIGQLRATASMTKLQLYSVDLYRRLEEETGVATGLRQNGSVSVALTDERMEEFKRSAAIARAFGLDVDVLSPADITSHYELVNVSDAVGGLFIHGDGQADPANIALALAKGARQNGARLIEGVAVTGILKKDGRVTGVQTDRGEIDCEYVVNCAGMWGRQVGEMAGVVTPLQACEHFYIVTEAIAGLPRDLPVLRVPDECAYYKEDAGKILLGAFEPKAKPWALDGIPEDFCFDQLPEDFDHFAPILEAAVGRLPVLESAGIHTFFNGPESFTPDDQYLLGEAPNLSNFYMACGFNSVGVQTAGGVGKALAEWMEAGEPPFDLWSVDIRRVQGFQANRRYLAERASETLGLLYADHFPYRQFETARNIRRSPIHDRLAERGACFGTAAGWERANWFVPADRMAAGEVPRYRYSWKRQNWFDYAAGEHRAVREGVALFDMTSFGKIRVDGRDAVHVLQRICGNDVNVEPGRIVYTQWLNERGGIEADLTITRLSETAFLVITSAASCVRDLAWIKRHTPEDSHCFALDVTSGESCLAIMGPRSRDLLQPIAGSDLSNGAFPFGSFQTIDLGLARVRAHRITYVGELGWELYMPAETAPLVFDTLMAAESDLRLAGLHVLDSCRMEKAFRHFGHDITDEDHVLEAGLGFAVKTDKPESKYGPFIGREAVLAKRKSGLSKRLLQFKLDDPGPLLYHNEPIWRGDRCVGYITSGNYGHTLGAAVGLGYVEVAPDEAAAEAARGPYEIEIACEKFTARASHRPLYDPKAERVRA